MGGVNADMARGHKRMTIVAGHYGSGKTNVAVNFALSLSALVEKVAIADLDIVNPYYRTKDSADVLEQHGIRLISSAYANTNVDVPAIPAEAYALMDDRSYTGVLDVGGDDRGALALGRYAGKLTQENDYELLLVINRYRPLTRDASGALAIMREIESAAGMRFTGIVNNSNLGVETTAQTVLNSVPFAEDIAKETGLPLRMTTALEPVCAELAGRVENLQPIRIYIRQAWSH